METSNDQNLKRRIIEQLLWNDNINANEVDVEVKEGNIKLTGLVPNYTAKLSATHNCSKVAGVKKVENFLRIQFPPAETLPENSQVALNLRNLIFRKSKINTDDVHLDVDSRVATFTGTVASYSEKYLLETIANSVHGVLGVNNFLEVVLPEAFEDEAVLADIRSAFRQNITINEDNLKIHVYNGTVYVNGTVPDYSTKKHALGIAGYAPGVVNVVDNINISSW